MTISKSSPGRNHLSAPALAARSNTAVMTELTWTASLGGRDSRQNPRMPITSIVGAETTSSALGAPIFLFKWLLVGFAALAWIVLIPLVDVLRSPLYPAGRLQ